MKISSTFLQTIMVVVMMVACGSESNESTQDQMELPADFQAYWMNGEAELTSYDLVQARYGEEHKGNAVLVFVTEDFSRSKQVKLDYPSRNPEDAVKVLKLNFTKKFNTGIYPYSMMQSIFTPLEGKRVQALKVTTSSQEWCGHTFTQMNLRDRKFQVSAKSYFESEGDERFALKEAILEDEIWNWIRINPNDLPKGDIQIIPGTFASRLRHRPLKVMEATATLQNNGDLNTYTLDYSGDERKLSIVFKNSFPYEIVGWEESYQSGWGKNAKILTTKASKKKSLKLDYWNKNRIKDSTYREKLGL